MGSAENDGLEIEGFTEFNGLEYLFVGGGAEEDGPLAPNVWDHDFELCRSRLAPGGVVTQWVPLYETTEAVVRTELATFLEVFPEGTLWRNNDETDQGYDLVLLGQAGGPSIDVDRLQRVIDGNPALAASLAGVGFETAVDLLETYAGRGPDLAPWLAGSPIHRDRSMRLEYLAGLALDARGASAIYEAIEAYRRFPEALFVAEPDARSQLERRLR